MVKIAFFNFKVSTKQASFKNVKRDLMVTANFRHIFFLEK